MAPLLRVLVLVLAVAVHAAVLYAPRVPVPGGVAVPGTDKVGHVAVFALVAVVALWLGLPARVVVPVLLGHAVVSEVAQHLLLTGRSGDPWDAVADVVGTVLGWLAWRWGSRWLTARRAAAGREPSGPAR